MDEWGPVEHYGGEYDQPYEEPANDGLFAHEYSEMDRLSYEEPANDGLFAQIAHEYDERDRLTALLETLPDKYRKHGYAMCESECEYDRVKYLKSLEMEEQGFKVTFIKENVDGLEEVSLAKLKRGCARVDYEADKEEINAVKLRLRQLSDQMNRDYGRPSNSM